MDGEYIPLYFDHPNDHPYYLRGHVSKEQAQEVLEYQQEITVKAVTHKYGRLVQVGPEHPDSIDGLDTIFRVIDTPRRSYYKVTECEPLLPINAEMTATSAVDCPVKL